MSKPPLLKSVSLLADSAGFSSAPASGTLVSCPLAGGGASIGGAGKGAGAGGKSDGKEPSYEYCDLKTLTIEMNAPDKSATIIIDKVRRNEAVDPGVAKRYRSDLGSHDIVIEALCDIFDSTVTTKAEGVGQAASAAWSTTAQRLSGNTPSGAVASKGNRPLMIKGTAVNKFAHSSFEPAHPFTNIETTSGVAAESYGGAPVRGTYFLFPAASGYTSFGSLWPFGEGRTRSYVASAHSCGNLPISQITTGKLSAKIYAIPYEETTISFGIAASSGYSKSTEWNFKKPLDGDSKRQINSVTTVKKVSDGKDVTTKTENMSTQAGHGRTRVTTETKTDADRKAADGKSMGAAKNLAYDVLGPNSKTVKTVEQSWSNRPKKKTEQPDQEFRKIKITRKIAGREVETDFNELIKQFFEIKSLVDRFKAIFDSIKFGASFSVEYELFGGELTIGWGNEWPQAYAEDKRVYYVQRYIEGGGKLDLFNSKVTGFCGLAIKPPIPFADIEVEIGGYLSASLKLTIGGSINHKWLKDSAKWAGKFNGEAPFHLEPGFKVVGRAFGYGVSGKVAIEVDVSISIDGGISTADPLWVKSDFLLGKESEKSTEANPDYDAVRLVAELTTVGSSVSTWKIEPYGLIKGKPVWKDHYLIGVKPKAE